MTVKTKSTVHLLCVQSDITNEEIPKEAAKLLEAYNHPDMSPEQRKNARTELDRAIEKMEQKIDTTRHLRNEP